MEKELKFSTELLIAGYIQMRDGLGTVIKVLRGGVNPGGAGDHKETLTTDEIAKQIRKH